MKADVLSIIPKGILFKMVKNKFSKKAGFKVSKATIKINYKTGSFSIHLEGENKKVSDSDDVANFSDMSEILLNKVKEKTNADKIDIIDLIIDLDNKKSEADIYFILGGEFRHMNLKEVF